MKRLLILFLSALAIPAWLLADDAALPIKDVRAIRDIQSRAYGSPRLDTQAPRGEAMLQLAELGASSSAGAGNLQNPDYDALFALLQRYRDELLKLGIDATDLDTQLKNLRLRTDELSERLDKLKPKDGLKIHGRIYSVFDDLHLLGNAGILVPGLATKAPGQGLRYQVGVVHSELKFTATRGPLSGFAQMDAVSPWGMDEIHILNAAVRRIYLQLALPVVIQVGDIGTRLTPLTLWRNEEAQPFEPEPFKSRRQRLRDDLGLTPDGWELEGARLSTEMKIFSVVRLQLESISAIMGTAASAGAPQVYTLSTGNSLVERFNTYMEGWRAALPIGDDIVTLSDNGVLFWDVTSTSPGQPYRAMSSMVQSARLDIKAGIFRADAEYALSSYTAPGLTWTAVADPLTGTAMTYGLGIETKSGHVRAFGRMVASSFHAAGAQGRTVDNNFQRLGPFLTENSQLAADGNFGLDQAFVPPRIPVSYASRFNDKLIPPGTYSVTPAGVASAPTTWQHLLPYSFTENIDPYGASTPNRNGFGAEGDWKFFGGGIEPIASYEAFNQIDAVADTTGAMTDPFVMTCLRAGLNIDFKPMLSWPLRLSAGYTSQDAHNGKTNGAGFQYALYSTLLDAGAEVDITDQIGLVFGYRHLDANGFNEKFWLGYVKGYVWDVFGYGLTWKPMDDLRFDAVYTQWYDIAPNTTGTELEVDQALMRLTLEF